MNQPLQNWYCPRCAHYNQGNWNACQMCRKPNPLMPPQYAHEVPKASNAKGIGIGFLVFICLCGMCGVLGVITDRGSNDRLTTAPSSSTQIPPSLALPEKVKGYSPTENLDNAKTLLKNKPSKEQAYQATIHLQAIPQGVAEYKESRKLLRLSQSLTAKYLEQEKREARRQEQALAIAAKREEAASQSASYARSSRRSSGNYYIRGPRGGCYYINGNGNKTYVDRSMCN